MPGMEYEEHEDVIAAGELLMLYSDGIVEARNQRRELFGDRRLSAFIATLPAQQDLPDAVCQRGLAVYWRRAAAGGRYHNVCARTQRLKDAQ